MTCHADCRLHTVYGLARVAASRRVAGLQIILSVGITQRGPAGGPAAEAPGAAAAPVAPAPRLQRRPGAAAEPVADPVAEPGSPGAAAPVAPAPGAAASSVAEPVVEPAAPGAAAAPVAPGAAAAAPAAGPTRRSASEVWLGQGADAEQSEEQ